MKEIRGGVVVHAEVVVEMGHCVIDDIERRGVEGMGSGYQKSARFLCSYTPSKHWSKQVFPPTYHSFHPPQPRPVLTRGHA